MAERYPLQNMKVAYRVMGDAAVLVHPNDSTLYTLNPVATRIWEIADGQTSVSSIVTSLCKEFDVAEDVARRDVEAFLQAFQTQGLLALLEQPIETPHG